MEHTIIDYIRRGGEKDLVTSPPDDERDTITSSRTTSTSEATTSDVIIFNNHSIESLRDAINRKFNEKLCNEVTITFNDKWIIPYNVKYIQWKLREYLDRWSKVADYIMIQDYSHVGRLHYHGIMEMKDIERFEREIINIRKTFGRVECKQITFWESYLKYMTGVYDPTHEKFMSCIEWNKNRYITNKVL